MSSLYLHGVSAAPPSSGYGDPYPLFLTPQPPPPRSYSSELVSLYGNDLSSSWNTEPHPLEPPLLSTVKRPAEEALFDGDIMSKQARVDSVSNLHAYPQRSGEKYCAFYMRTRTCSFGANCKYDHPTWVPIGGIPDWNEASAPKSNSGLPVHPGEPDCVFFSKTGLSKYGSKCLFNHPIDTSIKLSGKKSPENVTHETAVATISSMAANDTVYARVSALGVSRDEGGGNAPPKAATAFNAKGFPLRPGESDCAFYMKKGSCKFGAACRFNHPEQKEASVALQSQASGAAMLGGLLGGLVTPFLYARTLADSGLSIPASALGGINLAQTAYPQRPGEATCSYYLKTGTCKFGGCCKFHHPINRTDPAAEPSVKLTLAGLPRHEGKSSCPFYMKTGTCKFGTNCKFDHPPPGEAAAKALAEAGKSEEKQSNDGNPNTKEEN